MAMSIQLPGLAVPAIRALVRRRPAPAPPFSCLKAHLRPIHSSAIWQQHLAQRPSQPDSAGLPRSNARSEINGGHNSKRFSEYKPTPFGLLATSGLLSAAFGLFQLRDSHSEASSESSLSSTDQPSSATDHRDPSLPRFRLSEVQKHGESSDQPWVTYQDKVYDITDWVGAHPGGDVILRAAGGALEPYWDIFAIHKNNLQVQEALAQFLIGFIDAADLVNGKPPLDAIEDPFENDPARDPRLIIRSAKPRNAESPAEELANEFLTPPELFYVRNHMWVPVVEPETADEHTVTLELADGEEISYTLAELKKKFKVHTITAALQCSGNRRADMTRHAHDTQGLQWGPGAISNAEWTGVRLADVLRDAGLDIFALDTAHRQQHVQMSALEAYGASIPLTTALDPRADVLLAFEMDGAPLPRDHGFPLRCIVPGHVAARSVKWLRKIVIADEESPSQWQRRDYKCFGPNEIHAPDWDGAMAIQELPVTSAITRVRFPSPQVPNPAEENIATGKQQDTQHARNKPEDATIDLQGYAFAGGGRAIARVDVSLDNGRTWRQAELLDDCALTPARAPQPDKRKGSKTWGWTRWRFQAPFPADSLEGGGGAEGQQQQQLCTTLVVKATDDAYNAQPECHAGIYNLRGNLANAWHRVRVCTEWDDERGRRWTVEGCGFPRKEAVGNTKEALATAAAAGDNHGKAGCKA